MVKLKWRVPEGFLNEEIRDGYTVTREMKRVWAVLLDLLAEFRRVCEKHDIIWYADAGTILGAARHGGIIPWDDDIDVMLMRKDYDRLCAVALQEFSAPYFFQTEYTDAGSLRGHAQLRNSETTGMLLHEKESGCPWNQGIFLDIFPIDAFPQEKDEQESLINELLALRSRSYDLYQRTYRRRFKFNRSGVMWLEGLALRALRLVCYRYDYRAYYHRYEELAAFTASPESELVAKLSIFPFKQRRIWKRSWFAGVSYLSFENMVIPVPSGYIELLDCFYGDWHRFEVGASTHGGVFFDVDKPYTFYL